MSKHDPRFADKNAVTRLEIVDEQGAEPTPRSVNSFDKKRPDAYPASGFASRDAVGPVHARDQSPD